MFNEIESYARPFPRSTSKESPDGTIVGIERVPANLILGFELNPFAKDMLPPHLRYLVSEQYFFENTFMSVSKDFTHDHVLVSYLSGREIPVAHGLIPFGTDELTWHVGRIVSAKGTWVSGGEAQYYFNQGSANFSSHLGLLSVDGARGDVEISNWLLRERFRSALHLGFVVFDNEKLATWLLSRWKTKTQLGVIYDSFNRVMANGGSAQLFRLGGSLERINQHTSSPDSLRFQSDTLQSLKLLLLEAQYPGSHIGTCLSKTPDPKLAISSMETMIANKIITVGQMTAFVEFLSALFGQNAVAIPRAETHLHFPLFGSDISQDKDVDRAFFSYDYDEAKETGAENPMGAEANSGKYMGRAMETIYEYIEKRIAPIYFNSEYESGVLMKILHKVELSIWSYYSAFLR